MPLSWPLVGEICITRHQLKSHVRTLSFKRTVKSALRENSVPVVIVLARNSRAPQKGEVCRVSQAIGGLNIYIIWGEEYNLPSRVAPESKEA